MTTGHQWIDEMETNIRELRDGLQEVRNINYKLLDHRIRTLELQIPALKDELRLAFSQRFSAACAALTTPDTRGYAGRSNYH